MIFNKISPKTSMILKNVEKFLCGISIIVNFSHEFNYLFLKIESNEYFQFLPYLLLFRVFLSFFINQRFSQNT